MLRQEPGSTPKCYAGEGDHPAQLESVNLATGVRSVLSTRPSDDVALSDDGRYAAFSETPYQMVVDLATGKRLLRLDGSKIESDPVVRELSADGSLLLYGDRPLLVFDVATGAEVATLATGEGQHFGVGFGPGTTVYSTAGDASLSAWDATSGALLYKVPAAGGGRPSAAADGRVLVSDYISGQATRSTRERAASSERSRRAQVSSPPSNSRSRAVPAPSASAAMAGPAKPSWSTRRR